MARRRRGASARRGPKNNVWSVALLEESTIISTAGEIDIVDPTDWRNSSAGFERATLLRIRGFVSIAAEATLAATSVVNMAIYVTNDDDVGPGNPSATAFYVEDDVLWSRVLQLPAGHASVVERPPTFNFEVDVKAMRKITSG